MAEFERSVEMQNRLGVPSRMLTPGRGTRALAARRASTACSRRRSARTPGHATPEGAVQGYAAGARAPRRPDRRRPGGHGHRAGCRARRARARSRPSAWSARRARGRARSASTAGVELPVTPERRRIAYTGPMEIEREPPMTIDFATGFYFHARGPRPPVRHQRRLRDAGRVARARRAGAGQARARAARRPDRRRLVGRLRDDAGPQRADRRSRGRARAASSTPPASPATASFRRPASAR